MVIFYYFSVFSNNDDDLSVENGTGTSMLPVADVTLYFAQFRRYARVVNAYINLTINTSVTAAAVELINVPDNFKTRNDAQLSYYGQYKSIYDSAYRYTTCTLVVKNKLNSNGNIQTNFGSGTFTGSIIFSTTYVM